MGKVKYVYKAMANHYSTLTDARKGYTKQLISVSDFDWKRLGQFVVSKVRLLERNTGLLLKEKEVRRAIPPRAEARGLLAHD